MKRPKKVRIWIVSSVAALAIILTGSELVIRLSGLIDFPLYRVDAEIGYILAPNQKGVFLKKNQWIYNEKSQGAGHWKPNGKTDLLLLGDSIVLGGNPIDQSNRLGPQLQKRLPGWQVWPASAGSWSVLNEIAYLHRFPEVTAAVIGIVWVLNTGDFDSKSVWKTELTHPLNPPFSALWYVLNKYDLFPRFGKNGSTPQAPQKSPWQQESVDALRNQLKELRVQQPGRKVLFVLYPSQDELEKRSVEVEDFYNKFRKTLFSLASENGDAVLEVRQKPCWNFNLYRDGIHPSAEGNRVLAQIIADELKRLGFPGPKF